MSSNTKWEVKGRWKWGWVTQDEHRDIAKVCRDGIWKAKAQLKLELVRDVKGNKKGFFRYVGSKREAKENVVPQVNGTGDLVTKDMEKAEVLIAFFVSVFTGKLCPQVSQVPEPSGRILKSEVLPRAEEDQVKEHLSQLVIVMV